MSRSLALIAASAFAAASIATHAQGDSHAAHHPAQAASADKPAATTAPGAGAPDSARMAQHLQAMQALQAQMAAAKTPAERKALMAAQMKLMQDGQSMMGGMGPGHTADCQQQMDRMDQRMAMMQSMMQKMMDRMPMSPAAPSR